MRQPEVDGLAVLPELADDAILVCNLLDFPIRGRTKIGKVMRALEDHFIAVSDIDRKNSVGHHIIESIATLPSGERIHMTVLGTRDNRGWISEVSLTLENQDGRADLVTLVKDAAKP